MSEVTIDFIELLIAKFPTLEPIFNEHVSDNFGEVLPHLFFGDLTRYAISTFLKIGSLTPAEGIEADRQFRALLNDLEEAFAADVEEIQELIAVSFLENLPRAGDEGPTKALMML